MTRLSPRRSSDAADNGHLSKRVPDGRLSCDRAPRVFSCFFAPVGNAGRKTRWGGDMGIAKLWVGAGVCLAFVSGGAQAHSGGLNAEGCHNDRKNGGYHCHRPQTVHQPERSRPEQQSSRQDDPQRFSASSASFANCTAARAAGAAPVRRGQPGYGPHLDRDGDGVGCER